jgi:nucleosome binding factor SPN SPT16 subunit
MPYPDLGFNGVPNRSTVFLQPTVHALISISEAPFFVLSLSDIEIAYFERVQFNLRSFDLVFVFKDYDRPVVHINSIDIKHVDTIREWLE